MRPNPDIALIYHYDLARALAGEVVDWQAIPVNVQAGREGGDLCRQAADFGKRRDLFAMPAPTVWHDVTEYVESATVTSGNRTTAQACEPAEPSGRPKVEGAGGAAHPDKFAVPVPPVTVEQRAVDPRPVAAAPPVAVSAADRERLRARVADLVACGNDPELRRAWPEGVPTLKHDGHTPDQLAQILAAVRRVEAEVGAGWHPDDGAQPRSRAAIRRAVDAWAGRDPGTAWFAASLIATFEQCRNADATFEQLVASFTIEQADRLHDAAQGITP